MAKYNIEAQDERDLDNAIRQFGYAKADSLKFQDERAQEVMRSLAILGIWDYEVLDAAKRFQVEASYEPPESIKAFITGKIEAFRRA